MTAATGLDRCRAIEQAAQGLNLYRVQSQYSLPSTLPFLASPDILRITASQRDEIVALGTALSEFFLAVARERKEDPQYVFIRPDILVTRQGLKVCEVETSPFGFALSLFLQSQYQDLRPLGSVRAGLEAFADRWREWFGTSQGRFVFTDHSRRYEGQLEYLAELFQQVELDFSVQHVRAALQNKDDRPIYRCFYLHEREVDVQVSQLFERFADKMVPSGSSLYEGKKMLALWHSGVIREKVSPQTAAVLDKHLSRTWIINFEPPADFPVPIKKWEDLAEVGKSQRQFVVKRAGGHPDASWARSVVFLHKKSRAEVAQALHQALYEPGEWVIQEFIGNEKFELRHSDPEFTSLHQLRGRVRLTPYYSLIDGRLLTAKATLREGTLFIHASSDSVNTVIGV